MPLQVVYNHWAGMVEWWKGTVECVLQGETSQLMQFSIKVTTMQLKPVTMALKYIFNRNKISCKGCCGCPHSSRLGSL